MKFEEALKLQNFKEHYSIILGNVNIANTELERVLENRNRIEDQILILNKTVEELNDEVSSLNSRREQVIQEMDIRIKDTNEKECSLVQLREDTKNFVDNSKIELEKVKSELQKDIIVLSDSLNELTVQKSVMDKSIDALSKQVSTLSVSSQTLSAEVQSLDKKRAVLLTEIDEQSTIHRKMMDKNSKELVSIVQQIEESRAKVLNANKHFEQKEKDIARRENDVKIITRRLQTLFQEVKPGIALKI